MARRGNSTEVEELDDATVAELEGELEASEATNAEAVSAEAGDGEEDGTEPIDLTEFAELVNQLVTGYTENGEEDYSEATELYRGFDRRHKSAASRWFTNESKASMRKGNANFPRAQALILIEEAVKAPVATEGKAAKAPVDPTVAYVAKLATFRLAYEIASASTPEGVAEDWRDQVSALVTESQTGVNTLVAFNAMPEDEQANYETPESSDVVSAAVKLASRKITSASTGGTGTRGPRHDVGAHIAEAVAAGNTGDVLTIKALAAFKSEEYGKDGASASASAIMTKIRNDKFEADGVELVTDAEGKVTALRVL